MAEELKEEIGERRLGKTWERALSLLCMAASLFYLYTAFSGEAGELRQRSPLLLTCLVLVFLTKPMFKKRPRGLTFAVDCFLALLSIVTCLYLIQTDFWLAPKLIIGPNKLDLFFAAVIVLLVLESTRRILGLPMLVVAIVSILYARYGIYFPGFMQHKGIGWLHLMDLLSLGREAIWYLPMEVCATVIVVFILFGTFLQTGGGAWFFYEFPHALFGRVRGGPAKVSVVASGLFGTISGSVVANVVTTGTFTIPLMKSTGFRPEMAGAVEAIASTGGQIMPPIMGTAAFIMPMILGITYWEVCVAAFIPAVLYYIALFAAVDLEAARLGLKGLPSSMLPSVRKTLAKGWFLVIPIFALVFFLGVVKYTPMKACFYTIVMTILINASVMFAQEMGKGTIRGSRATFASWQIVKWLIAALDKGMRGMPVVTLACASAGIIIGMLNFSGIGLHLSTILVELAGGRLLVLLVLVAVTSLILGMGLTTTACYLLLAFLVAPALVDMGVPLLSAHLFIFYFGCLCMITPPVAIGAYAAAPIAGASPFKVGFTACRLGIVAYIVPFYFVYNPLLIMQGEPGMIALAVVTASIGAFCIAAMGEGYLLRELHIWERVLFGAAGLLLIYPSLIPSAVGLALLALGLVSQLLARRKAVASHQASEYSDKRGGGKL